MDSFRERGFVGDDTLEWVAEPGLLHLCGYISCLGGIVIDVRKTLSVQSLDDDPQVQTEYYAYQAWVRGHHGILRYDSTHPHDGHLDEHHVHYFDWRTDEQTALRWVGAAEWPTLGQVIEEVERWYWESRDTLPAPDSYGSLVDLRRRASSGE
ncbi:MAG: hypothetical protein J0L92_01165 [Deltaproteobacteria bacterium]|nr:hypothetical protein [Deltaproteobacteria bacterium]